MRAVQPSWEEPMVAEPAVSHLPVQPRSLARLVVTLFKLRIVSLLLLAAYGGAATGLMAGGRASLGDWLLLTVCGALSAAGASAINQYLERDRDTRMLRTAARPLAVGAIVHPKRVLVVGVSMVLGATVLAARSNPALAFWVFAGALIYVAVYTMWLKPRTTLNIVIGGAAGSCAVLSGGAAVGAWNTAQVWILAALLFVWTPVHFWSLALAYREDYARAEFPMLPARVSATAASNWIALHTLMTIVAGMALAVWPTINLLYLVPVTLATLFFVVRTLQLLRRPVRETALALFHSSNLYLAVVLFALIIASIGR